MRLIKMIAENQMYEKFWEVKRNVQLPISWNFVDFLDIFLRYSYSFFEMPLKEMRDRLLNDRRLIWILTIVPNLVMGS